MAELTFKTDIQRENWPRWMIKLNEYLARIYSSPIPETEYEDYDRLRRIIFIKLNQLRKEMPSLLEDAEVYILIQKGVDGFSVSILVDNERIISYYIE